jgi:subtilisin
MVSDVLIGQSDRCPRGRRIVENPCRPNVARIGRRHVMRRRTSAPLAAVVILLWCAGTALAAPGMPTSPPDPGSSANPAGRWIVLLKPGTDTVAATAKQGKQANFKPDRVYRTAVKGYAAHLDAAQLAEVRADPTVAAVVPDEAIQLESQTVPTGITRIGADRSSVARIDGSDERVDADVAIVDTGISLQPDLNVVGGVNCSTSDRAAWRDVEGHGTHVAGTVGAIDNGMGVVGVAPGVRLWAVKILNDSGEGLLSWYVCGLDWIAAQRDPNDSSRPLFEAVNMSVAKWGKDDLNCGATNHDILHAAICRLVKSGVTVVAAAGNDSSSAAARVPAAYNEVITVSALADTDGKPGGLGGHRCYSWGTYDVDDTFADFSNRGSDIDVIAPGKCIWSTIPGGYAYMSGTSMAAPHVTGAVALLKASRPGLTPGEVREAIRYLGTMNWRWSTDPDPYHEPLLDVSRIGPRGDFSVGAGTGGIVGSAGGVARFPVTITRSATSFERVRLSAVGLPAGWSATFDPPSVYGFTGQTATALITAPAGLHAGTYDVTIRGDEHGNQHDSTTTILVDTVPPTGTAPATTTQIHGAIGSITTPTLTSWPAGTDANGIAGYELQKRWDSGPWYPVAATTAAVRTAVTRQSVGHAYVYRLRTRDTAGNWSGWVMSPRPITAALLQDPSTAIRYGGTWRRHSDSTASGGTTTSTSAAGSSARVTFVGQGIAIAGRTGTGHGHAKVYVDGTYRTTISFWASTTKPRQVLFSAAWVTPATHTIEIRAVGDGAAELDAFVILR